MKVHAVLGPAVLFVALALGACGGGSSPSSPSPPSVTPAPGPSPSPAAGGATVTITSAGVSPKQVEIAVGSRVTFVNQDGVTHEIDSNPHPVHTDCPPINEVDVLGPGQSRQTGVFTAARTCGYHDHGQPTNPALQGTIVVR